MKAIKIIALCLIPISLFAQEVANSKVIKVSRNNNCFGVEMTNLNLMYLSIDNPFKIIYSGRGKLIVRLNNGSVTDLGEGNFIANINEGKQTVMSVYEVNGKVEKPIGKKIYRLKPVPKPVANIGGIESGGIISKNMLLASNGVNASLQGFLYDVKYEIVSYSFSTVWSGEFKTESCIGAIYTSSISVLVSKLKNNSCVIFEDIKVRILGTSTVVSISPVTLRVNG